jgi:thioredoxin-related protein
MKKLIALFTGLLLIASAFAQVDTTKLPYQKFPTYPPVKLLLADSLTYYTKADLPKKSAVMLMIFNPECSHCQHETEEIIKNIEEFKNIQIVMVTMMPLADLRAFKEKYKLDQFENIVVTKDPNFFLATFYMLHNLPFLAFYNKKKELISVFEGSMPIEKVLKEFEK